MLKFLGTVCLLAMTSMVLPVSAAPKATASKPSAILTDWRYVEKRLSKAGFDAAFIKTLEKSYEAKDFKDTLELNLLLFLRKTNHHAPMVSGESVERIRGFMTENKDALKKAESEHGVPGSVIASLLFIESRYGKNLGRFHVPSVYLHLLQADRPSVIRYLQRDGSKRFTAKVSKADLKKIASRTKKKAEWALSELKAIRDIYKKGGESMLSFRGSFAGAFGMSQFIPSSYGRWARTSKKGASPDLTNAEDAILSVAYYLKDNGWKPKPKARVRALMRYNNSEDYANAILELAEMTEAQALAASP